MSDATPLNIPGSENQNEEQPLSNLTNDDQVSLKFHQDRLAAKEKGKLKSTPFNDKNPAPTATPPRVRAFDDVDFSKARPNCKRCKGTGILHYQIVPGTDERIPVICKCLTRNGGLKKDQLDRILARKPLTTEDIARLRKRS